MLDYFTTNDNFNLILSNVFNDKDFSFNIIPTGWTNIVLDVNYKNENYICKFPRNSFWAQQIQKDCNISNFVREKMNIHSPNMKIYKIDNKCFSIHKKISGKSLAEKFKYLSHQEKEKIAQQLANIFYKMHSYNVKNIDEKYKYNYVSFLKQMIKIANNYDMKLFESLFNDNNNKNNLVFAHNDINVGNIIIDDDNNIVAIIDYAFAGLADIYTDLSVISCRTDDVFYNKLINEYSNLSNITINKDKLNNRIKLRQHLEDVYIEYIKNNCFDIKI